MANTRTLLYPAYPESMEPTLPETTPSSLESLAFQLAMTVTSLNAGLHPITRHALEDAFRYANSYYSNLIEGNSTHPIDIERAAREGVSAGAVGRSKLIEATAHVAAQKTIEDALPEIAAADIYSCTFLKRIHFELYSRIPAEDRFCPAATPDTTPLPVTPGALRTHYVQIGAHIAPKPEALEDFLRFFQFRYTLPESLAGTRRLVAIACAHHRFSWIHPFTDGNRRVARLFSHAAFVKAGLGGPWSINRGLARARTEYMRQMSAADMSRQGDSDGRGNLSQRALLGFCEFFLGCALEQAVFAKDFLALPTLTERIHAFLASHEDAPLRKATPTLTRLLRECLFDGELPRSAVAELAGVSARTATTLTALLLRHGLVTSPAHNAPLCMAFPQKVLPYYFPAFLPALST